VLGDCHFSFLKTPGTQDPSFAGVILSTYSTKCTVYTLTLVPVAKGNASLSLAEASVKRYGDAGNILSSTQNGSYTLTAALKAPAVRGDQAKERSQEGLYTVELNVLSEKNTPVSNATVILTPVEGKARKQATTNTEGAVHFTNLQAGIYDATIEENNTKVGERIINVSGANHVLTLGINITGEQNNPLMKKANPILKIINPSPILIASLVLGGIVLGSAMAVVFIRLRRRKKIPA
jgi:hypothetical protein